jgi:hypothetical protein
LSTPPAKFLEKRASRHLKKKKKGLFFKALCASSGNVFCWQQETHDVLYYGGAADHLGVTDLGLL